MSGYQSVLFRHNCESQGCFQTAQPSWDFMLGIFPRNIHPTDIDGMVEINDHFLFLEQKAKGKHLEEGQRKAFQRLAERPKVTVAIFRANDPVSDYEVLFFPNPDGFKPYSAAEFVEWIRLWAFTAEQSHLQRRVEKLGS